MATAALSGAACAGTDPEQFFPDDSLEPVTARAVATTYCHACPVREACLQEALRTRSTGVWAGTTTRQRDALRRRYGTGVREEHAQQRAADRARVQQLTTKGMTSTQVVEATGLHPRTVLRYRSDHHDSRTSPTKKATA